ncbi:hypothetical protein CYMTET_38197 [Cymbomonas tetramitiformis]|uniref:RING-type domain-containing protein n=1 Tax=Cymbomonas tetramitiformis TaxID=36881 RepID=A0AAE0F6T3_9CHLO|nr:hypothetical protein CYMTET_38197 [Cymbomonas tetramitiformis]
MLALKFSSAAAKSRKSCPASVPSQAQSRLARCPICSVQVHVVLIEAHVNAHLEQPQVPLCTDDVADSLSPPEGPNFSVPTSAEEWETVPPEVLNARDDTPVHEEWENVPPEVLNARDDTPVHEAWESVPPEVLNALDSAATREEWETVPPEGFGTTKRTDDWMTVPEVPRKRCRGDSPSSHEASPAEAVVNAAPSTSGCATLVLEAGRDEAPRQGLVQETLQEQEAADEPNNAIPEHGEAAESGETLGGGPPAIKVDQDGLCEHEGRRAFLLRVTSGDQSECGICKEPWGDGGRERFLIWPCQHTRQCGYCAQSIWRQPKKKRKCPWCKTKIEIRPRAFRPFM